MAAVASRFSPGLLTHFSYLMTLLIFLLGTVAMCGIVLGGLWLVLTMQATDDAAEQIRQARRGGGSLEKGSRPGVSDDELMREIEQWREGR